MHLVAMAMDLGAWPSYAVWQHLGSIIDPSFYGRSNDTVEENDVFFKKMTGVLLWSFKESKRRVYRVTLQQVVKQFF
jgi:hypothetical protein